jgi:membrane-associated phospholipid phosphatase
VPALTAALSRPLAALAILGAGFGVYTQLVAAGFAGPIDLEVARWLAGTWRPGVQVAAQAVAVAGGIEVTAAIAIGIAVQLWRRGFRAELAALLALPAIQVVEIVDKRVMRHPPPLAFSHADGPSLVTLLHGPTLTLGGSYPSGHMMRTVLIYGLGAFVVSRLSSSRWLRNAVVVSTASLIALMALDRLYLGVHWQSDVLGGLLLGGAALAGAVAWLDRPRAVA